MYVTDSQNQICPLWDFYDILGRAVALPARADQLDLCLYLPDGVQKSNKSFWSFLLEVAGSLYEEKGLISPEKKSHSA